MASTENMSLAAGVLPKKTFDGPQKDYVTVDYQQPHWARRKAITKIHPEVGELHFYDPSSAWWTLALVSVMYITAYLFKDLGYGTLFLLAYCFGAFVDHGLWVLVHDLGHNTAFETKWLNSVFLVICNIPHILPSSVTFKYYHKQHHTHLNELYDDPDIPGPSEQAFFGNSCLGKMGFLLFFPFIQAMRTFRYGKMYYDHWVLLNYIVVIGCNVAALYYWGPRAFFYLAVSFYSALSFHPCGARWIAEHYALRPEQETYSYYGPINLVSFNIGYHNEHHDYPRVPWSQLPKLTKMAPEFYQPLYQHPSYVGLMWQFFFDPNFTLQTRVVRQNRKVSKELEAEDDAFPETKKAN